jgi:glutathionylspermidine synthase
MLEFNAETPTDIVEAFYVNGKVCGHFGVRDPNAGMSEGLGTAFAKAVAAYRARGYATERIVFSSVDWHDEDAGTTRYLLSQSGLSAEFVPLSQLRVFEDRVQVWDGREHTPVDLMYRLHPLEKLAEEQDPDGYPTGRHALDIVACGKLALVNPPAALIAQSKAVQALIWNLHENNDFFAPAEHAAIQQYLLPTYFENRFAGRAAYVTKPIFGREGGAVTVFGPDGVIWARDEEANYWDQPVIYQQYAELPQITVETLNGLYCGRMIFGSFLVDGQGSGVVARVGSRITGNMAYYQPLCVSADAPKGE